MAKSICCSFSWQEAHIYGPGHLASEAWSQWALQVYPPHPHIHGLILGPLDSSSSVPGVLSALEQVGGWGRGALGHPSSCPPFPPCFRCPDFP